jgi:short subunit fatty acids transporter
MERASALYINMHIENKTALETIAPEITKDSRNAKKRIINQANSTLADKNNSSFSIFIIIDFTLF